MSLEALNERVRTDLGYLAFGGPGWVRPLHHPEGHVYDAVIVGGGQSGLGAAFGLLRERISNILVIDENPQGMEGPWETYARMATLRTPKHLTSIDLGVPSLTFRAWWEAQYGSDSWEQVDKIPRTAWMDYLRWFRSVLGLPVINGVRLELIESAGEGLHRLHTAAAGTDPKMLLARKVVLATGIQGGGQWHVPPMISANLPRTLYAHASEPIDMNALRGKAVGILGGGASAFDNADYVLANGASEAHVFVRRAELPGINPIRQMEVSGMIERFHTLSDAEKYGVIAHFFQTNQPPTNDMFESAASRDGFRLHLGSPLLDVQAVAAESGTGAAAAGKIGRKEMQAEVTTPGGTYRLDYLIVCTGLMSDPALRPELRLAEPHIARWGDRYRAPADKANPLLDAHPYLTSGFALTSRNESGRHLLHGLFVFNYSALASCGLSASAISGTRHAIPKLAAAVADQLFLDDKESILDAFYAYSDREFTGNTD